MEAVTTMAERDLRAQLSDALLKHVRRSSSTDRGDPSSYTEYEKARTRLFAIYSNSPHNLDESRFNAIIQDVEDACFASSKTAVDRHIAVLNSPESTENEISSSCYDLSFVHFRPWYQQERYYSADYFARRGGIRRLVEIIGSRPVHEVLLYALSACWNFCSSDYRSRLLIREGILDVLKPLMEKSSHEEKRKCYGLLWGLLEFQDIQIQVAEFGFLDIFCETIKDAEVDMKDVELALGCAHCCCSNFRLHEQAIQSGLVDAILGTCVNAIAEFDYQYDEDGRLATIMLAYTGYNALASLCLHVNAKQWLETVHNQAYVCDGNVKVLIDNMDKKLRHMSDWMEKNDPDEIREREDGHYVWRYMRPFTALLFGRHPVVRRMGAFAAANLMQGAENREICAREDGNSYAPIQCTAWGRDERARQWAKKAMSYIYADRPDPPPLQAICRYYISDNFERFSDSSLRRLPRVLQRSITPFDN